MRVSARGHHQVVERLLAISRDTLTVDRSIATHGLGSYHQNRDHLQRAASLRRRLRPIPIVRILALTESWLVGRTTSSSLRLPPSCRYPQLGPGCLDRLAEHGRFTDPTSSVDAITALADLVSPVAAFVRDRCVRSARFEVPCDQLYTDWRRWQRTTDIDPARSRPSAEIFEPLSQDYASPGSRRRGRPPTAMWASPQAGQRCADPRTSADQTVPRPWSALVRGRRPCWANYGEQRRPRGDRPMNATQLSKLALSAWISRGRRRPRASNGVQL